MMNATTRLAGDRVCPEGGNQIAIVHRAHVPTPLTVPVI